MHKVSFFCYMSSAVVSHLGVSYPGGGCNNDEPRKVDDQHQAIAWQTRVNIS